jgi:hypothetical protein
MPFLLSTKNDDDSCVLFSTKNQVRRRCVNLSYFFKFSSVEFSDNPWWRFGECVP